MLKGTEDMKTMQVEGLDKVGAEVLAQREQILCTQYNEKNHSLDVKKCLDINMLWTCEDVGINRYPSPSAASVGSLANPTTQACAELVKSRYPAAYGMYLRIYQSGTGYCYAIQKKKSTMEDVFIIFVRT